MGYLYADKGYIESDILATWLIYGAINYPMYSEVGDNVCGDLGRSERKWTRLFEMHTST